MNIQDGMRMQRIMVGIVWDLKHMVVGIETLMILTIYLMEFTGKGDGGEYPF